MTWGYGRNVLVSRIRVYEWMHFGQIQRILGKDGFRLKFLKGALREYQNRAKRCEPRPPMSP